MDKPTIEELVEALKPRLKIYDETGSPLPLASYVIDLIEYYVKYNLDSVVKEIGKLKYG